MKSISKKPTLNPLLTSVKAKTEATRLLPTPPFPLETAMILRMLLSRSDIRGIRGSVVSFHSFDAFNPDSTSGDNLEVGAAASGTLHECMSDLGNKMDGFSGFFVQLSR